MSDAFLNKLTEHEKQPPKSSYQIYQEERKRKAIKQKPKSELEREKIEEGLSKRIEPTNKGFLLLQKMGYKTGTGLGKQETGIVEPIGVHIKRDRSGLGEIEEKINKKTKIIKNSEVLQTDFKQRMAQQFSLRKVKSLIKKCIFIAQQMDEDKKITNSPYAPKPKPKEQEEDQLTQTRRRKDDNKDDEEDEEETLSEQQLIDRYHAVLRYLRDTHLYCLFCTEAFASDEELALSCPGIYEEDHEVDLDGL